MGRGAGIILGLMGLILPGFLLYKQSTETILFGQGFFYKLIYALEGSETSLSWISNDWLKPAIWGGDIEFYVYLASFALAVLGLLVMLGSSKGGAILFLLAGLATLGLTILTYSIHNVGTITVYPIPVGAILLLLAGIVGVRD